MAGIQGLNGFAVCATVCVPVASTCAAAASSGALLACMHAIWGFASQHACAAQHDGAAAGMAHLREAALRGWCVPCGLPGCWHAGISFTSLQRVARLMVFC